MYMLCFVYKKKNKEKKRKKNKKKWSAIKLHVLVVQAGQSLDWQRGLFNTI